MRQEPKRLYKLLGAFLVGILMIAAMVSLFSSGSVKNAIESLSITKDGKSLSVSRDGNVTYTDGDTVYSDHWDQEKTRAFFDNYDRNYSGNSQVISGGKNSVTISKGGTNYTYILDDDDELFDLGGNDAQEEDNGNGGGGSSGGGGGVGQYFNTSSPTPKVSSTPGGGSSGGNSGGNHSDCLYWKLSYCVIPRTPTPTFTPQPSSNPDLNVVQANNCGEYLSQENTPTIISNTVCIPEVSPTP